MNINTLWPWLLLLAGITLTLALANWQVVLKALIAQFFKQFVSTLMTDDYRENLLELYAAATRTGFEPIMELNLRAEKGKLIKRPMGSARQFADFSGLMFDVAQLHKLPVQPYTPVNTQVVIGPLANRPLVIETPIMIGGMAYGTALSAKAKIALAKGATAAGTAINSGGGPFLQAERDNASRWIFQYNRGFWAKDPEIIRLADAVEIQFGLGALAGIGYYMEAKDIDRELQIAFPIQPGRNATVNAHFPEVQKPSDIIPFIREIKSLADGKPVGIKMACGKDLEWDLDIALQAGVDFISVSGAQGATHAGPPSIADNYALPTLFAILRAARFFEQQGVKGKVTLICDGGFTEPGEMLKALALGADAIYIGTAALFAISHTQVLKALPWEPPTQIVWHNAKYAKDYDENQGGLNLGNFLKACTEEMAQGVRALGKTAIKDVSRQDLFALDRTTAEITGLPLGFTPSANLRTVDWDSDSFAPNPRENRKPLRQLTKKPLYPPKQGYRMSTRLR